MQTSGFEVYVLCDPQQQGYRSVCYVGASKDARKRLREFVCFARRGRLGPSYDWVRQVLANGQRPKLVVLARNLTAEERDAQEAFWISYYRALGANLTNQSDGAGTTGYRHSLQAIERMSAQKKGRPLQPETLAKAVAANTGKSRSMDVRAKVSAATTARYADPSERQKTSEAIRNWWAGRKSSHPEDR